MFCFLLRPRIPEVMRIPGGGVANGSVHRFNISRHRPNLYFSIDRWVCLCVCGGGGGGGGVFKRPLPSPLPKVRSPTVTIESLHSNSAVRTRVITNYVFSHASVHITKRALTINVVPLFLKLHRPILYGNIIKRSFNPLLTYD